MTSYHLGCALSLLAGFAVGRAQREATGSNPAAIYRSSGASSSSGDGAAGAAAMTQRQRKAQALLSSCRSYGRRCAELFRGRVAASTALDCAR
jgi:hypothetical protein